ncbi:hypothetical protein ABZ703_05170, partial [Streptomyces massasporeus]
RARPLMADLHLLVTEARAAASGGAELRIGSRGLGLARQLLASMDSDGQAAQGASSLNGQSQKVPVDDK